MDHDQFERFISVLREILNELKRLNDRADDATKTLLEKIRQGQTVYPSLSE